MTAARNHRSVRRAGTIAVLALLVVGCGVDNFKDIKNVRNVKPDYIVNVENMDRHPNIGMLCIHGAGFATTTRSYTALQRVPEWDAFCATQVKKP